MACTAAVYTACTAAYDLLLLLLLLLVRTSISCPILSTPCRIDPPATPPFKSSTSLPGLFTSNDLQAMRWHVSSAKTPAMLRVLLLIQWATSALHSHALEPLIIMPTLPVCNLLETALTG